MMSCGSDEAQYMCMIYIYNYIIHMLREQIERHNFDHVVVFDWVLVKSLIGSNCFVSPAPMMILLSLCFSVTFILQFKDWSYRFHQRR